MSKKESAIDLLKLEIEGLKVVIKRQTLELFKYMNPPKYKTGDKIIYYDRYIKSYDKGAICYAHREINIEIVCFKAVNEKDGSLQEYINNLDNLYYAFNEGKDDILIIFERGIKPEIKKK